MIRVFLLFLCCVFVSPAAWATPDDRMSGTVPRIGADESGKADEPAAGEKPAEPSIDYETMESAGLWSKPGEGSLGRGLWDEVPRSALTKLLKTMPAASEYRGMQTLIHGALLSETNAAEIVNDVPPHPGGDILTLRLEKLMEGGMYAEAFDLYTSLNAEPYHVRQARAGILAMLHTGQKSLACVEAKTAEKKFPHGGFWAHILAYCDYALADVPTRGALKQLRATDRNILTELADDASFTFEYTPESFEALTPLERGVLIAEQKLDLGKLKTINPKDVPPGHIRLLLVQDDLPEKYRMLLTVRAIHWGLGTPEELQDIYTTSSSPAAGPDMAALDQWERLPFLYQKAAGAAKGEEQWAVLKEAFTLQDTFGPEALTPFADMIEDWNPENPAPENMLRAMSVLHTAGKNMPDDWTEKAERIAAGEDAPPKIRQTLLAASYVGRPDRKRNESETNDLIEGLGKNDTLRTEILKNIIENIDKDLKHNDNALEIYEKDFDLTLADDYVMPSWNVWDRLLLASQSKSIGETVLLTAIVLRDKSMREIYPGLFRDALQSLNTVGLTDTSADLAMDAVLGSIEKTKGEK